MARTAVCVQGQGPPVVLLHGLGLDGSMWRHQVLALIAAGYSVVTCDLLGHGQSDKPCSAGVTYAAADLAQSLTDALAANRVRRSVIVGFSLGGAVALQTALCHSERVSALVLANTSAWMGPDAWERFTTRAANVEANGVEVLVAPAIERWFTHEFIASRPDVREHYTTALKTNDALGYAAACRALASFDVRERLAEIRCPTLVLVGDRDQATPVAMAELLAAGIPGATLRTLAPSGHLSTEECADTFTAEVLRFLKTVPA